MMRHWLLYSLCLGLLLTACTSPPEPDDSDDMDTDTDGDGLSDDEEDALGTDSSVADTDADGIDDGDEITNGTNPLLADTDMDGYRDDEEIHAGTDPLDGESVIYEGGWPYNMNKDTITDPGWEEGAAVGNVVPHFVAMDQHDQMVDLYDFAFRGKKIVLDTGTPWCKPCQALAAYLSDGDESHLNWTGPMNDQPESPYPWWNEDYSDLYRMVQDGEIYWLTIIFSPQGAPIDMNHIYDWDEEYPNDKIPVLFDEDLDLVHHIPIDSYPTLNVLDENLEFLNVTSSGAPAGFRILFP